MQLQMEATAMSCDVCEDPQLADLPDYINLPQPSQHASLASSVAAIAAHTRITQGMTNSKSAFKIKYSFAC